MSKDFSDELIQGLSIVISKHPFLAVLLLTLHRIEETTVVKRADTNQHTIRFNPDFMASLAPEQRAFAVGHEVLHTMLDHVGRASNYQKIGYGPDLKAFNPKKWNQAADYVVNALLVDMGLKVPPPNCLFDPRYNAESLVDDVYCDLPEPEDNDDNEEGDGEGEGGHGGFDQHRPVADNAPNAADVAVAVTQAVAAQKATGNMPGSLQRFVDAMLKPSKSWAEELRDLLRVTLGNDELSWARPNRRKLSLNAMLPHDMPFFPGTTGHGMGGVVIGIDTSGSVGQEELRQFMGELSGILTDCRPEWLRVVWTDSVVAGVDAPESPADLVTLVPKGGGGTYMPAIFDWVDAEQLRPDICVVLTDGYTDFGSAQPYPVVWGITTPSIKATHGRTLHIPAA